MLLADAAAALDIPVWIGVAGVGGLASVFAWAGNRAVKANDDRLTAIEAQNVREAKARHDLAGDVQKRHDENVERLHRIEMTLGIIKSQLGIRE